MTEYTAAERAALDREIYSINPAAMTRATLQPRRLGGADFDKEGPFRGFKSPHPLLDRPLAEQLAARTAAAASEAAQRPRQWGLTLTSGYRISEAAAARLTPGVLSRIQRQHDVRLSLERLQLMAGSSYPMVGLSSVFCQINAVSTEFHRKFSCCTATTLICCPLLCVHSSTHCSCSHRAPLQLLVMPLHERVWPQVRRSDYRSDCRCAAS
jgi:hypothetical protein